MHTAHTTDGAWPVLGWVTTKEDYPRGRAYEKLHMARYQFLLIYLLADLLTFLLTCLLTCFQFYTFRWVNIFVPQNQ